ncbi:hypothetical protein ACRAR1_10915 [Streptomyces sanyensis]|uniref:hypothetical protein n=1 Tax=Streptomyces sanyensis TaxID=568869 RepID=UPI003D77CC7B
MRPRRTTRTALLVGAGLLALAGCSSEPEVPAGPRTDDAAGEVWEGLDATHVAGICRAYEAAEPDGEGQRALHDALRDLGKDETETARLLPHALNACG